MSNKVRILVVDDDTNICRLVKLYLDKEGYKHGCTKTASRLWVFSENLPRICLYWI